MELQEYKVKNLIVAGGVAANQGLRKSLEEMAKENDIHLSYPEIKYCTDNAAMIAVAGYYQYKTNPTLSDLSMNACASLDLVSE